MDVANDHNGSNLCVSTHVGRKEDQLGTLLVTIEDIKTKMGSAKPGEAIESGLLECGDMQFKLFIFPNGSKTAGYISIGVGVCNYSNPGKKQWKSIKIRVAKNSTGLYLKTHTCLLEDLLKNDGGFVNGPTLRNFLPHNRVVAEENSAFFPNGVLTVKANIKVQGEEIVTHKTTKLPDESITPFQLKGELSVHLRKMFESHHFSDFRVICQEEIIPCHRSMLAARSEYFEAMFEHNMEENRTGEVVINDFDLETVKAFILHMYTGEVEYTEDNTEQLVRAADKYQLHGLKKKIEDDLIKTVKTENAIAMFVLERHTKLRFAVSDDLWIT